ncbi:MAG: metal-dependent hydrolase [Candidatus Pacearchaeota archaeon]
MMPVFHIVFGLVFSLVVYFLFNLNILAFFILFFSTWISDLEFLAIYAIKNFAKIKEMGLRGTYTYFIKKKKRIARMPYKQKIRVLLASRFSFFHSFEFIFALAMILFFVLKSFSYSIYLWYFLVGITFHLLLDILEGVSIKEKFSIILFYIAKRKWKMKG